MIVRGIASGWCACLFAAALALLGVSSPLGPSVPASTPASRPLTVVSNESTAAQLRAARTEGDATAAALAAIEGEPMAVASGQMRAGEYRLAYVITPPEGYFSATAGSSTWQAAAPGADALLRVFVVDGAQDRMIPGLSLHVRLGTSSQPGALPYGHYPLLDGYGDNVRMPADGNVRLVVDIDAPQFLRHDPYNGDRFGGPVVAVFPPVHLDRAALANAAPATTFEEGRLDLARAQGSAIEAELVAMKNQANDLITVRRGPYDVTFAVEFAEAWWHFDDGRFTYSDTTELSARTNAHVEVAVRDARSGRFVPDVAVEVTCRDATRGPVADVSIPLMWHPWLYHYGGNIRVPRSAFYAFEVRTSAPSARRYGRLSGKALSVPIEANFAHVNVVTGQK